MKIQSTAKNGVITLAYKAYNELTATERAALTIVSGSSIEDYADFAVHYNKKNELIRVVTHSLTQEKSAEIEENTGKPNLLTLMMLINGDEKQKKQAARVYKRNGMEVPSQSQIKKAYGIN